MASPRSTTNPSRNWLRVLALGIGLAVLAAAAAGTWYLFLRAPAPSAVALGAESAATPTASAAPTESADTATPGAASAAPAAATGLDGTWTVDASIGSFDDFSGSFVGYRVQEELVGVGAATAVGRTPDVTGSLTLDGSAITEASFEADLTTLSAAELAAIPRQFGLAAEVRLSTEEIQASWDARFERMSDRIDPQTRTIGVIVAVDEPYRKAVPGKRPP